MRKPNRDEQYLMSLLHYKTLEALEERMNSPATPEELRRIEPPWDQYEEQERVEEQDMRMNDLERLYALSSPPE